MKPGSVAVVIANWNLKEYLREGLASVVRETGRHPYEITVVDNGSSDGAPEMVAREFPRIGLVRNAANIGFVRASNLGVRRALESGRSDYVLLLNADIVVRDGAIDRLADYLDAHAEVGAVGPLLVLPDGRFQAGPAGFKPTFGSALAYFCFGGKILPYKTRPFFIDPDAAVRNGGRPAPVEWVSGACLLVRADVIRRVGLMSEDFFLYADDIEWGVRMCAAGCVLHFLPSVQVTHHHGMSMKTAVPGFNTRWLDQLFRYVRKDRGPAEAALFRMTAAAGFGLRALIYALQALVPSRHRQARLKVRELLAFAAFSLRRRS